VFHFNKKHLEDQTVPMWVLKTQGETFYVNHVDCEIPWSTKETPDNPSTKGSIKVKDALLRIDEDNNATLSKLNIYDKIRLRNQKLGITRIMFRPNCELHKALQAGNAKHGPFKHITGACATSFVVTDILEKEDMVLLALQYASNYRVLKPNEGYYQAYDTVQGKYINVDYKDPDTPYEYS